MNWKRHAEEISHIRLGDKITRLKTKEKEIQQCAKKRIAYDEELRKKSLLGIKAHEFVIYKQFDEYSRAELLLKEIEKREASRELDQEREELIARTKERKIFEKLKEKRLKSFLQQAEKIEQKSNDEMTVMKYKFPTRVKPS